MEKEIILLRINQIEKQLNELKELLLSTETKTHDCNANARMVFDYQNGTSNSIKHKCIICGADIIPINYCTSHGNGISKIEGNTTFTDNGFSHFAGNPIN